MKNALNYFFSPTPGSEFSYYTHLLILAALLIVGSLIFASIYKKRKKYDFAFKRLFKSVSGRSLTLAIILLVIIAVRYENIPYFAMRFWLYVALLWFLYLIVKYLMVYFKDYPREKQNVQINQKQQTTTQQKMYLPNKRR